MQNPRKDNTAGLDYERACLARGKRFVAGLDEAGRGPWAGPLYVGMVMLPLDDLAALSQRLQGVQDSKQTTPRQREHLVQVICAVALTWGLGQVTAAEIDALGITAAIAEANQRAVLDARARTPALMPDCFLLDHFGWNAYPDIDKVRITHGDQLSLSIAAASIVAKTARDAYMRALDDVYPLYAFGKHKGYGTPQHRLALRMHGVTPEHRRRFAPVQAFLS